MKKRTRFQPIGQTYFPNQRKKHTSRSRRTKSWGQPFGTAMMGLGILFFTGSVSGQAVPLGYSSNYAIVSAAGVTNSGFTVVNGNIALSPTPTIIGFINAIPSSDNGFVNGVVHYNNELAQAAQLDARAAYNTLAGTAPGANLTGSDLGGMTLAPGVYTFNSSAFLTGNLTLATGAVTDAVYIFQIGSTLITATNAQVIVTGAGVNTPNIFWQVGSSATFENGTMFSGNVLADISITMKTGANLANGRAMALTGAVSLLTNTISAPVALAAGEGRYWNGYESNLWSESNWSSTAAASDQMVLGSNVDVVFSVTPAPTRQDTNLDKNFTISSLTVNDTAAVTISGPNKLTVSATGLITGININSLAGLTTINSNLELGFLSKVITVNNTSGMVINGVISGTNGLTKAGTGSLTITGVETYTGATVVSGGTLQLGNGVIAGSSIAMSNSILIAPTGTFALNLANGETFSQNITDNGQIRWIAPGTNTQASTSVFSGTGSMLITAPTTTVLMGDNTFSGGTVIDTPGDVFVGNISSNTSSPFGSGILSINAGTIDTVNSQLLQIEVGGYEQSGGQIAMHLEGTDTGDYTKYVVANTASLSGGTVFVYDLSGNYVPYGGDKQIIIATQNGLGGTFASDFPESHFYNEAFDTNFYYQQGDTLLYPTITYDSYNANVLWVQDSFASLPDLTENQVAIGDALDGYVEQNAGLPDDVIAFLNGQDLDDLPAMYDLIAPDELTAIFQMGFTNAGQQYVNVQRHLAGVRNGASTSTQSTRSYRDSKGGLQEESVMTQDYNHWNIFFEASGGSISVDASRNANGYDFDTESAVIGADKRLSDTLVVGFLGSYGQSDASLVNGGSIDVESFSGAVYATYHKDGFYLDALLGAGHNSYDTRRASLLGFAEGNADGWQLNSMLNAGYDMRSGNWILSPNASVSYTRVTLDGFTETGSMTPLNYPTQHQDSLRTELGLTLAYEAQLGSMKITPQVRVGWQHEFFDSTQSIDSRFTGGSSPLFTVDGPHMGRDRAVLSAGVNVQITPNVSVYGYYDGQLGSSNYNSNQVTAGVNIAF